MPVAPFAIKPSYDTDASAYFTTAGVTSTAGRQQVSRFVTGIKDLGLWNNMVCWPLRSSQNAGTGTTAYSLGGLGIYNGTLANGPTWGSNGVNFDGSDDYISTNLTSALSEFSFLLVSKNTNLTGAQAEITKDNADAVRESAFLLAGGNYAFRVWNPSFNPLFVAAGTTNRKFIACRASSSVFKARLNNNSDTSGTTGALTTGSDAIWIGAQSNNSAFFNGEMSFASVFNTALSDSNTSSIYSLIKTTIGQELGLP